MIISTTTQGTVKNKTLFDRILNSLLNRDSFEILSNVFHELNKFTLKNYD